MAEARDLFCASDLSFAELRIDPDDPVWGEDNLVTHPIVALPCTPVWQQHDGAAATLANANHAVFHHAWSEYRRERFQRSGYRCLFFFPGESLVREIASEVDPSAFDDGSYRFPACLSSLPGPTFALARRVAARLASGRAEPGEARESLYDILRSTVLSAYRGDPDGRRVRTPRARGTHRAHAAIVEEAKTLLTRRLAERVPLELISHELHVSPYHLARVFRVTTGYSLHGYQTNLRVREGLDRLVGEPAAGVGEVAGQVGFSTASHFAASFRRTLGVRPSQVGRA